ncbi:hypothetical protein OTU49_000216, partial [Cherax quadricarinatus]
VWWSGNRGHCQTVDITRVSSYYFELSWHRSNDWFGVTDYEVVIAPQDPSQINCNVTIMCNEPEACNFNSSKCGLLNACSSVNFAVTGGDYTVSDVLFTAPVEVENMKVNIERANLTVSWDNPAALEATCLQDTILQLEFGNNIYNHTMDANETQGFYWLSLCEVGEGEVRVWNRGGSGESEIVTKPVNYTEDDLVLIVDKLTLTPGCGEITATWSYNHVCWAATHFILKIASPLNYFSTKDTSVTSHVFKDLNLGEYYTVSVTPLDKDNFPVGYEIGKNVYTLEEGISNLVTEAQCPCAIYVSWEPSTCCTNQTLYTVTLQDYNFINTSDVSRNTSYKFEDLIEDEQYHVCVTVSGKDSKECVYVDTVMPGPDVGVQKGPGDTLIVTIGTSYWCYDCAYNVSWGPNLENFIITTDQQNSIDTYNTSAEELRVCASIISMDDGRFSCMVCRDNSSLPTTAPSHRSDNVIIIVCSVSAGVLVLGLVIGGIIWLQQKNKHPSGVTQASGPAPDNIH